MSISKKYLNLNCDIDMLSLVIDIYLSTMKDLCVTDSEYLAFRLYLSIDNLKK